MLKTVHFFTSIKSSAGVRTGAVALLAIVAGGAFAQGKASFLMYGGKVASRRVRVINGESYVPVRDVATALGMKVVSRSGGLEMTREGGANQMEGLRGKVGDTLFNGFWRFQVTGLKAVKKYDRINNYYGQTENEPNEGEVLLAVECIAKNGTKETAALRIMQDKTQVTGTDGTAMGMTGCDMRVDGAMAYSTGILPGAAHKVVLLFSVPKDFEPKDLVITMQKNLEEKTERTIRVAVSASDLSGTSAD